jgi:hypothetical protein
MHLGRFGTGPHQPITLGAGTEETLAEQIPETTFDS